MLHMALLQFLHEVLLSAGEMFNILLDAIPQGLLAMHLLAITIKRLACLFQSETMHSFTTVALLSLNIPKPILSRFD